MFQQPRLASVTLPVAGEWRRAGPAGDTAFLPGLQQRGSEHRLTSLQRPRADPHVHTPRRDGAGWGGCGLPLPGRQLPTGRVRGPSLRWASRSLPDLPSWLRPGSWLVTAAVMRWDTWARSQVLPRCQVGVGRARPGKPVHLLGTTRRVLPTQGLSPRPAAFPHHLSSYPAP